MGSFVSSYPATGSFSRTAINYNSGVRTTAGGIVTGAIVLLALGVMSPYFRYIPKASLSALIFVSVLSMVHCNDMILMWRTNKWDLLPFFATLVFSFIWGLEYGILIGVGISVCFLLFHEARPKFFIQERKTYMGSVYLYVKPDRTVFYPSAELLQSKILKALSDVSLGSPYVVVLDGDHILNADYTAAVNFQNLVGYFKRDNIFLICVNWRIPVKRIIEGALMNPEPYVNFVCNSEVERVIDDLYIVSEPTSFAEETRIRAIVTHTVVEASDSGLYEK